MEKLIHTETSHGCEVVRIERAGLTEVFLKVYPNDKESPADTFRRLDGIIKTEAAAVVKMDVFGLCSSHKESIDALRAAEGKIDWPITWVQGGGCFSSPIAGIQVYAVKGGNIETIEFDGRVAGRIFQDDCAKYCLLGDIRCEDISAQRQEQTRRTFENIERSLKLVGMDMQNVVRTWFYNDHIFEWYGHFNEIRTNFFKQRGVLKGVVPVSTGIGGSNPASSATVASALAMQPLSDSVSIEEVASPLQESALEYGSSFSRAIEVNTGDLRRLFVSGTASIAPDGKTAHIANIDKQIELTVKVVNAILESQQMSFSDATRAIAYVKQTAYAKRFIKYCEDNNMPMEAWLITHNDICRDQLLFEVELDAVSKA